MNSNTVPNGGSNGRQSDFFPEQEERELHRPGREWRGEIAQRVAAHKARARATTPAEAEARPATNSARAATVSQRALENVRRRMEERAAREAAIRREREELECFFAESERALAAAPAATSPSSKLIVFPRTATLIDVDEEESAPVPIAEDHAKDQLTIFEEQPGVQLQDERVWHFHRVRPVFSALRLDDPADFISALEGERPEEAFELPLKVASFTLRGTAAVADLAIVLSCAFLFAATFYGTQHQVPHGKSAFVSALLVSWTLWILYQFLFLAYTGSTPGLRLARLGISDFEDRVPTARMRIARAAAMVLSSLSCGLGFVWALLDEDRLAWHDRMTRTFPRELA